MKFFRKVAFYLPNIGNSWLLAMIFIAGSLAASAFIGALTFLKPGLTLPTWCLYLMSMVVPFFAIWLISNQKWRQAEFYESQGQPVKKVELNKPDFGRMGAPLYLLCAVILTIAASIVIEPLGELIPMPDMFRELFEKAFVNSGLADMIIATCILAPLCEEFLCRGVMMRGMAANTAPWKAILWAAIIFAFIHLNPWQAIPALLMGLLLGWVYHQSGCIWAAILMHAANNSFSTAMMRIFPDANVDSGTLDLLPAEFKIPAYIGCVILVAAVIFIMHRFGPRKSLKQPLQ